MAVALVYATFPDMETARSLAREMLEARFAACATFWDAGSLYWWEGEIEAAEEAIALFKTHPDKVEALTKALAKAHPYEVPCILPVETTEPFEAYAAWIEDEATG